MTAQPGWRHHEFHPEADEMRFQNLRSCSRARRRTYKSYLKKVFGPDFCLAPSSQILDILEYACGLTLGRALNANENPNFEMASNRCAHFAEVGHTALER
jgi:hypothetical protein